MMTLISEDITSSAKIIHGDCLEAMSLIPDNSIDLIITDPPYNLGKFMKGRGTNMGKMRNNHFAYSGWDDLDFENWCMQMDVFLKECHRILKKKRQFINIYVYNKSRDYYKYCQPI